MDRTSSPNHPLPRAPPVSHQPVITTGATHASRRSAVSRQPSAVSRQRMITTGATHASRYTAIAQPPRDSCLFRHARLRPGDHLT
jgi:hypothetical protein